MDLLDFGLKPLSDYLSGEVRSELRRWSQRRSYGDKDALHMRGDGPARLCMIVEGKVRFGRFQHDGSFKLLAMLGPGAHYGDVALQRRSFTQNVYASGPTEIEVIDAASLEALLRKHPDLALALLRCNTATARLAKVIYVHLGRGGLVNGLVCLQSDLAELLGVSKVAIGKAMRELEQSGLVQCGYRQIIVPDKSKLKAWLRGSGAA